MAFTDFLVCFYVHFVTPLHGHVLQSVLRLESRKLQFAAGAGRYHLEYVHFIGLWPCKLSLNYTQIEAYIHEEYLFGYIYEDSVSDQMYFYVYPCHFANIYVTHQIVIYYTRASCWVLNCDVVPKYEASWFTTYMCFTLSSQLWLNTLAWGVVNTIVMRKMFIPVEKNIHYRRVDYGKLLRVIFCRIF